MAHAKIWSSRRPARIGLVAENVRELALVIGASLSGRGSTLDYFRSPSKTCECVQKVARFTTYNCCTFSPTMLRPCPLSLEGRNKPCKLLASAVAPLATMHSGPGLIMPWHPGTGSTISDQKAAIQSKPSSFHSNVLLPLHFLLLYLLLMSELRRRQSVSSQSGSVECFAGWDLETSLVTGPKVAPRLNLPFESNSRLCFK